MRLSQEPCQELQKIIDILKQISNDQEHILNSEINEYFFKEFISGLAKTLTLNIKVKSNNQEFIELIK